MHLTIFPIIIFTFCMVPYNILQDTITQIENEFAEVCEEYGTSSVLYKVLPYAVYGVIYISGDPFTHYKNNCYEVHITFTSQYPELPPIIKFLKPVPINKFVYSNGDIALECLKWKWWRIKKSTIMEIMWEIEDILWGAKGRKKPKDDEDYCIAEMSKYRL